MPNSYFQFKEFTVHQDKAAMKVTTDACLFGAWVSEKEKEKQKQEQEQKQKEVLDIGAGTGLLSLMIAQKNPDAFIDAIEIDEQAFQQATENKNASPFADRIHVIHGDAKNFQFQKQYDCIISNPPFYENELKPEDEKKLVAHHNSGLLLSELAIIITDNLKPGGQFFILLPYKRYKEINSFFKNVEEICFVRQSVNHDYFRIMLRGSTNKSAETSIDEISITNDVKEYTPAFIALLKDYYLHL